LYVSSTSLDLDVTIIQECFCTITRILEDLGLQIELSKLELAHFSWRHKETFPMIELTYQKTRNRIKPSDSIKWLGIWFDSNSKLTFRKHTQNIASKTHRIATGITMLANTVKGLHQTRLRTIY
ncbi:hypothetical protein BKA83DRAFT_4016308, partial [Pisolithus microcarpus]